jgi:hypothetical protein
VVATTAEETHRPQRDLPVGILGALGICTLLYVAVSLVITGIQPYTEIDPDDAAPWSAAFAEAGKDGYGDIIALGALVGLVVVVNDPAARPDPRRVRLGPRRVVGRGLEPAPVPGQEAAIETGLGSGRPS